MISAEEFKVACSLLVDKYSSTGDITNPAFRALCGWMWHEHPVYTRLGYLSRISYHSLHEANLSDDLVDESLIEEESDDPAVAATPGNNRSADVVTCCLSIVYSPTYGLPVLYFTIHDSSGSPLALSDMVRSTFFRKAAIEDKDMSSFALSPANASFPLLSQGDHPVLGTPSWYLHPCETGNAVGEIMDEVQAETQTQPEWLIRLLEAWVMVLDGAVDMGTR